MRCIGGFRRMDGQYVGEYVGLVSDVNMSLCEQIECHFGSTASYSIGTFLPLSALSVFARLSDRGGRALPIPCSAGGPAGRRAPLSSRGMWAAATDSGSDSRPAGIPGRWRVATLPGPVLYLHPQPHPAPYLSQTARRAGEGAKHRRLLLCHMGCQGGRTCLAYLEDMT